MSRLIRLVYSAYLSPVNQKKMTDLHHLHMSWSSDIIPAKSRYLKFRLLFDWFHGHLMEPITENLSLSKQNMFFVEKESENCISTEL